MIPCMQCRQVKFTTSQVKSQVIFSVQVMSSRKSQQIADSSKQHWYFRFV